MRLWIGNIAPDTTDEQLKELIAKYSTGIECLAIQRVEGDGSRPGAILTLAHGELGAHDKLAFRLDGMYWQERKLVCSTMVG
jgi:hypothetical protein